MKNSFTKIIASAICIAVLLLMTACGQTVRLVETTGVKNALTPDSYGAVYKLIKTASAERNGYKGGDMFFADGVMAADEAEASNAPVMEAPTAEESGAYIGTNVQVDGIDESDIVKTDGRYIFAADTGRVKIIRAYGAETEKLSETEVCKDFEYDGEDRYVSSGESIRGMFVSGDILGVITAKYEYRVFYATDEIGTMESKNESSVNVYFYDITAPESPRYITSSGQNGYYRDARMAGGTIYLVSNYYVYEGKEDDPETYVPILRDGNESRVAPLDCIVIPENTSAESWTVISAIDMDTGKILSNQSVLGGVGTMYMNDRNLYLANTKYTDDAVKTYTEDQYKVEEHRSYHETEVMRFEISDGAISYKATGKIPGHLLNQFSMDEKDGFLRLVATDNTSSYKLYIDEKHKWTNYEFEEEGSETGLYILNGDMTVTGKITDLAEGERIYSVRFMGDTGYFVTFRETDPLFAADLKDPSNPKILSALKIPGFSTYMQSYGDGLLIGIGRETDDTGMVEGLKLSMFDISDPADVKEISKLVLEDTYSEALYDHHAVIANADKNIIGFFTDGKYLIFGYEDGRFFQRASVDMDDKWEGVRGFYIGGNLYIASHSRVTVLGGDTFDKLKDLSI